MSGDITTVREALLDRWPELLSALLDQPSSRTPHEWRWNRKGSLSAVMSGPKVGRWFDHEAGIGGGPLEIIIRKIGGDWRSAADWARQWLEMALTSVPRVRPAARRDDLSAIDQERRARVRRAAAATWDLASPASPDHPYLISKGVSPHGIRSNSANALIITLRDIDGTIHTIELIDETGGKRFLAGGAKAGHFALIGDPLDGAETAILCEGWATGASIHEATGLPVVAAMDAGNLRHVAPQIRSRYPLLSIIIAADNDAKPGRKTNPGVTAATVAAGLVGARVAIPPVPGDFNDMAAGSGLDAVRRCIAEAGCITSADPTYPVPKMAVAEARASLRNHTAAFIAKVVDHWSMNGQATGSGQEEGIDLNSQPGPPRLALPVDVGLGKSSAAREAIAELINQGALSGRKVVYAIPRHDLGTELAKAFADLGITAMVWKGRTAPDPTLDDPERSMCLDLDAMFDALQVEQAVEQSSCKVRRHGITHVCPRYHQCGYQAQKAVAEAAQVVICAHDSLFHQKPTAIGKVGLLVIDEAFWQAGLFGIDRRAVLTLDGLSPSIPTAQCYDHTGRTDWDATADLVAARGKLSAMLGIIGNGAIPIDALAASGLTAKECLLAAGLERSRLRNPGLLPGMGTGQRSERISKVLPKDGEPWAPPGRAAAMWILLADALKGGHDAAGAVKFDDLTENGTVRSLRLLWRGDIRDGWIDGVPVLHLDATMRKELVLPFLPKIEISDPVIALQPHATMRQILGTPTSARALTPADAKEEKVSESRHLRDLATFVAIRATELRGCGKNGKDVLVIGQMKAIDQLRAIGLPRNVDAIHFNALSGMNRWSGVAGLIVLGRTLPPPQAIEYLAAALTNRPIAPSRGTVNWWYEQTPRYISRTDGIVHMVEGEVHADPCAESIRWSICEGELIQAIGRARGVNRTEADPLRIDLLNDIVIPHTATSVATWKEVQPNRYDAMASTGVVLDNAADMARCFPDLWSTRDVAKKDAQRRGTFHYYRRFYNSEMSPSSVAVSYQPAGAGQKPRMAVFDVALIADPAAWLQKRLGSLVLFEMAASEANTTADDLSVPTAITEAMTALSGLADRLTTAIRKVIDQARDRLGDMSLRLELGTPTTVVSLAAEPPFDPISPAPRPIVREKPHLVAPPILPQPLPGEGLVSWGNRAMRDLQCAGISYVRASSLITAYSFRFVPEASAEIRSFPVMA